MRRLLLHRAVLPSIPLRRSLPPLHALSTSSPPPHTTPPPPMSNVVALLRARGLLNDVTSDRLESLASRRRLSVYCGFDPTADSLHLGNLLGIIVLAWFARCGHQPVALLGGATGRVGDPSGKSAERPMLSEEAIDANVQAIGALLQRLLGASSSNSTSSSSSPSTANHVQVVNNLEWFGKMTFLQFLRDIGKYARVGTMLSKDSVKTRLASDSGISFTEFSYQLLQGYDFVHLYRHYGVQVQIGGSDQWGNIVAGTELMRKLDNRADDTSNDDKEGEEDASSDVYGVTFPLLVDASGKKFGKSENGAIWLSADKLSPYQFYQYLFKTTDADVIKFLKMLTFVDLDEIAALELSMKAPEYVPNSAQRRLAEEVTRFVHGDEGVQLAVKATEGLRPGAETVLDAAALEALGSDVPSAVLPRDQVVGRSVADVLAATGLQPSRTAARKLIKGGGVRMNNAKVESDDAVVEDKDLIDGRMVLLAAGKKNKMIVKID